MEIERIENRPEEKPELDEANYDYLNRERLRDYGRRTRRREGNFTKPSLRQRKLRRRAKNKAGRSARKAAR